jgi:hypothetical protein
MKKISTERNIIIRNINAKLSNPKIKQEIWTKYAKTDNSNLEHSNVLKSKTTLYEMKCHTSWCMNLITPFNFHIGFLVPLNIRTSENIDKNNLIPLCRSCSNGMNNKIRFREWDKLYVNPMANKILKPPEIKQEVKPVKLPESKPETPPDIKPVKLPEPLEIKQEVFVPKMPIIPNQIINSEFSINIIPKKEISSTVKKEISSTVKKETSSAFLETSLAFKNAKSWVPRFLKI